MTDGRTNERRRPDGRSTGQRRVNAIGAARRAGESLRSLTRRTVESVVEVSREDGGGWLVAVEVLETPRIPDTSDVLAVYEVELDQYGALQGYRRRERYTRGSSGSD